MSGPEIPTWDPATALLIGTIPPRCDVLCAGYAGFERLVAPRLMRLLIGGDGSGR